MTCAKVRCCVGGVISPVLLNVALHGLEEAAGVRYRDGDNADRRGEAGSPVAVRYADDFVTCCLTDSRPRGPGTAEGMAGGPGPVFNQDKTRIVHLTEGFDFLGFTFRRYPAASC